ncbi:MAG: type II toxin-antitoxin system RatA family toxin [Oleiphilaceae bacterium]|nr:type II toxin-antitoxin system RatA family toxin [Oleiphilaceae bacterium]
MPHRIDKSALVMHSADRMFALVNDIARYPEFLPWCARAEVHQADQSCLTASLEIARGGVRHRLTTRNDLILPGAIEMTLVEGPFQKLRGRWDFKPLDENACKVLLAVEFEFSGALSRMTFGPVFTHAATTMVDAFCRRADDLYREVGS